MIVAIMTTALSGTAWADEVVAYTLTPASGSNNGYANNCDIEINGITWNLTGNSTTQPWRIGGKSLTSVDRTLYSKTAITDNVSKIEVTHGAASSITVNSWTVIVSKNSDFSNPVSTLTPTFAASTTTTITRPDGVDWSNCYYKFVYNVSVSGNTNRYILFSEAKFYKETGTVLTESDLSLSPTSLSFDLYNDNSAKTITCTTSSTGAITVSASDYVETSVSGNTITVTPVKATPSPQTITVNQAADATYAAGEKTFTVTISNSTPAIVYEKVTNANQLVAGNEYILVASTSTSSYAMGNMGNNLRSNVEVTVDDDAVSIQGEPIAVLTLGGISGAWTFLASDNDEYLAYSGSSNQLYSSSDASAAASKWVVTDDFQLESANVAGRYLQYNASSPRFACYTGSQTDAFLYVKQGGAINTKVAPGYSFSAATAEAILGEQFTAPTFSNPNNVSVTFTSTDPTVATISDSGVVTLVGAGNTVISATSVEDETYEAGTASYTLTVIDPNAPGTENNPYTVAEARAAIDAGTGVTGVYATGIVSEIVEAYSSQYHNISYNISADGLTTSDQLEIYRGKSFDGEDFTSENDIQVGDVVVVFGNLTKYNSTYEFAQSSQLVSLVRPEKPKHTVSFSVNGTVTSTDEVSEQSTITFPANPADIGGKTFVGWTTAAIEGTTDTAPTFVTSATMGTADVTYYAVFATQEGTGSTTTVTDVLTRETTGVESTNNYTEWSDKTVNSAAVYAGQSAGGNESIQLRSNNNNSGIVTTTSGGKVKKVTVTWNSNTQNGRTLNVYGSNTAYTAATDLYGDNAGTLVGTIVYGTSTELTINDDYTFVGLRSASGAMYLTSISIDWETGTGASYSGYCTTIAGSIQEVEVTDAGYATFVAAANLEIPEGVEVFAVTVNDGAASAHLEAIESGIPAGEAVLVKASPDTYEFTYTDEAVAGITNNDLRAATTDITADGSQYCLAQKNDVVGFYKVQANIVIPAGKAYLVVTAPAGGEAKAFYGFDDDATGISNLKDSKDLKDSKVIYNLAGQRLQKMQKGINIVNGKKVLY